MNPREIQKKIALGEAKLAKGRPPLPPPEWHPVRRRAIALSIRCAVLFVRYGMSATEIQSKMKMEVSKQRVNFRITKGCKFLLTRGYIVIRSDQRPR